MSQMGTPDKERQEDAVDKDNNKLSKSVWMWAAVYMRGSVYQ